MKSFTCGVCPFMTTLQHGTTIHCSMAHKRWTAIFGSHDDGLKKRKNRSHSANRLPPRLGGNRSRLPVDANTMLHASDASRSGKNTCDEKMRDDMDTNRPENHIIPTQFSSFKTLRSVLSSILGLSEKRARL